MEEGAGDDVRFIESASGGKMENICSSDFCGP